MFSKLISSLELRIAELTPPEFTAADWQTFMILGAFTVLLALEASAARKERRPRLYRQSYLANLGTFVMNDTLLSLLSVSSLWLVAERFADRGLLSAMPNPLWKAALSFILLDLTLYFWHRASHTFDWLWMFHKVHHSDRVMNVSTAFRLHFMEVLLTMLVKALFIVAVGVDAAVVVANEAIVTLFVMFHHANLSFRGERWLSWLAIVPSLHRVHHSAKREEHDSNYGAVFSWWDRLFGTLAELKPAEIGLKNVGELNPIELVKFGLTWRPLPSPSLETMPVEGRNLADWMKFGLPRHALPRRNPLVLQAMIEEAAYYRAEKRGFAPGYEFLDWLEAEREIRRRF
jgi:sterol desaturase/sphingolipid hydroxylase (fatty acid hydroxylase superfamily)